MLETEGVIPFTELDIKKLKGQWDGYFRLRVGQIRVIFTVIDSEIEILLIQDIGFRGGIYN
jgi:mRNA interferase RelE/StbE